ncbi:MAG: hypothetical protein SNJ79_05955, partial [Sphingomonadaceae bacterium]
MSFFKGGAISGGQPPAQVAPLPLFTSPPAITGTLAVGSTITLSTGTATGASGYARQLFRDGAPIPGATGATYQLAASDAGRRLFLESTPLSAQGPGLPARSALVGPIGFAPVHASPPSVSGVPRVGLTISATAGMILGLPMPEISYQWRRGASNIPGATSRFYTLAEADLGEQPYCRVTATNTFGSASADTALLGVVTEGEPPPAQLQISGSPPALMTEGGVVNFALTISGGTAPYSITLLGVQPSGFAGNLSGSTYTVSFIAGAASSGSMTFRATDAASGQADLAWNWEVQAAAPSTGPVTALQVTNGANEQE